MVQALLAVLAVRGPRISLSLGPNHIPVSHDGVGVSLWTVAVQGVELDHLIYTLRRYGLSVTVQQQGSSQEALAERRTLHRATEELGELPTPRCPQCAWLDVQPTGLVCGYAAWPTEMKTAFAVQAKAAADLAACPLG